MSDVGQRVFRASNDAVDLSDVGTVIRTDHDGIERWRRAIKMHQQATFVAF